MHSCGCVQCANICWPIDLKSELGGAESVYAQTVLCLFQPKTLSCMAYSVAELHHKVQTLSNMSCTLYSQGLWDFRFLLAPKDIIPCKAGNECSHHCYAPPPPPKLVGGGAYNWGFNSPLLGQSLSSYQAKCVHVQ